MPQTDSRPREHAQGSGPVGRALRVALGALLLGSIAGFYADGSRPFVLTSAAIAVGLVIVYTVMHPRIGGRSASPGPWLGSVAALIPLILVYMLGTGGGLIFGAGEGQTGRPHVSRCLADCRGPEG